MAKTIKLLTYVIRNAEQSVNAEATKATDTRFTVIGAITVNGKTRKTDRVNFTLAQTKREGFTVKGSNTDRTLTITMPTSKAGRKRLAGTDLENIKL
jgi:hypothetical protein